MNTGNHRELEGIGCRPPKEYSAETPAKAVDYGGELRKAHLFIPGVPNHQVIFPSGENEDG
jgi:hypothetical protein